VRLGEGQWVPVRVRESRLVSVGESRRASVSVSARQGLLEIGFVCYRVSVCVSECQ
jgi:hypothetical protein